MALPRTLVVVMAGGEGSRLGLLTERRAKPVMPVGGAYRLIDIPLSNCTHSSIDNVWVVQQQLPASLAEALGNGRAWDLDRSTGGLRTLPPSRGNDREGDFSGTADALWKVAGLVREFAPDVLLVASADAIYRLDYHALVLEHLESGAELTMVTAEVSREAATRLGVVTADGNGRVTGFEYKPEDPVSTLVSNEIFAFDSASALDRLDSIAEATGDEGMENLQDELIPEIVDAGAARVHHHDGYWRDVGTIESYWEAHMELVAPDPPFEFDDPEWPVLTPGQRRPPVRLRPKADVRDSLVSGGCDLGGTVRRSVVSPNVVVERGATVDRSVLLPGAVVRAGARVRRTIVDSDVAIGRDCDVGGPRGGIAVIGRATTVRKGTRVPPGEQRPLR